nr:hypothetical protein [Streptomyces fructofermentans]
MTEASTSDFRSTSSTMPMTVSGVPPTKTTGCPSSPLMPRRRAAPEPRTATGSALSSRAAS